MDALISKLAACEMFRFDLDVNTYDYKQAIVSSPKRVVIHPLCASTVCLLGGSAMECIPFFTGRTKGVIPIGTKLDYVILNFIKSEGYVYISKFFNELGEFNLPAVVGIKLCNLKGIWSIDWPDKGKSIRPGYVDCCRCKRLVYFAFVVPFTLCQGSENVDYCCHACIESHVPSVKCYCGKCSEVYTNMYQLPVPKKSCPKGSVYRHALSKAKDFENLLESTKFLGGLLGVVDAETQNSEPASKKLQEPEEVVVFKPRSYASVVSGS